MYTFFSTQTQEKASFDQVLNLESGTLPHVSEAQYVMVAVACVSVCCSVYKAFTTDTTHHEHV